MDYSFMKTGFSPVKEPTNKNFDKNLVNILELFTSNAVKNSVRFVKLCDRNGVTKEDMKYGLIYEVFEFFKRDTNLKDLKEIEEKMFACNWDQYDEGLKQDVWQMFEHKEYQKRINEKNK